MSDTKKLLEWNDDIAAILGRPCFACAILAEILRRGGASIPKKAEHEQARVLFWTLNLYLQHGEGWKDAAAQEIERIRTVYEMLDQQSGHRNV